MVAPLLGTKACKNCRFAQAQNRMFECRFGPPIANAVFAPGPDNKGVVVQGVISVFPIMGADDWCHKFERSLIQLVPKEIVK